MRTIPGKATIDYDGYELLVKFEPYRPDIVEEIKGQIPQHSRVWDADERFWRISFVFRKTIEGIFDVFDYSIRDYSGTDTASKVRQARLKGEREARRAADQAKAKAEEPKKKAPPRERKPPRTGTHNQEKSQQQQGNDFADFLNQLKMKQRFQEVWPECDEKDFRFWWSLYTVGGREYANRIFSDAHAQKSGKYTRSSSKPLDPYTILAIMNSASCSEEEVKVAYRKAALVWHPDRNSSPEATKKMQEINAAYDEIREGRGWK